MCYISWKKVICLCNSRYCNVILMIEVNLFLHLNQLPTFLGRESVYGVYECGRLPDQWLD